MRPFHTVPSGRTEGEPSALCFQPSHCGTGGSKPFRLLDLFCCAGGAGMGYHQAGFDVVGVDIHPQPRYPFKFIQADVLSLEPAFVASFDAIHASPPCQAHTAMKTMHNAKAHPDLVAPTRAMLIASGRPWVIENVVGAPLKNPIMLCGTMFGLGVEDAELQRHRLFELSEPPLFVPQCQHGKRDVLGVYGGHVRNRRRARTIGIYGEGARDSRRKFDKGVPDFTVEQARLAMGIDWMTLAELCQSIPPAYTEYIGRHLMAYLSLHKEHHPRAFQQPTTDAAAMGAHLREQAAAGAGGSALAANGHQVSAALHHGADVTTPDFICHDGLPRSSTINRSEMGVIP